MKTIFRATLLAMVFVSGCVPSLNPVYTNEDLVFEPAIVGLWKQERSRTTWEFRKHSKKGYRLVVTDKSGKSGRFIAHLAKFEDTMFLDLFPDKPNTEANAFYTSHFLPFHTIYLVEQTSPTLKLATMDIRWLNEHLANSPESIEHKRQDKRGIITAPTKELQGFLLKHKDRFTNRFVLSRQSV